MSASSKKKLRKEQNAEMMTERQKQEHKEAKKTKAMTAAFIAVLVLVVGIFVGTQVVNVVKINGWIEKMTVAATVGEHKLDSITMNYFYMDAIETEYNSASQTAEYYSNMGMNVDVASMLGYDPTKSLSKQTNSQTGGTWAAYYWDIALNNAKTVYAMYDKAVKENFTLPEDYAGTINQNMMNIQLSAAFSGSDTNTLLRSIYGNGANEKTYREFLETKALATAYYQNHQDTTEFDAAARSEYLTAHANDFTAYNFNYYSVNHTSFLPALEGEGATHTDEQKKAAREEAKTTAEALAANTSIETLDAAIAALSYNEGKTVKSTVANDVMYTSSSLADDQKEWISSADRKQGDAKAFPIVTSTKNEDGTTTETIDSYRVVMYVSTNDFSQPLANVRHLLVAFEHKHVEGDEHKTDANGNTVYTDAEKAAAKAKAEELMNGWDKTEASFIELIKNNTDDEASAETGGLYEDIDVNANYETNFLNWAVDPARKAGDYGLVETSYGYHIMFYVSNDELTNRDYMINQKLLSDHMTAWEKEVVDVVTVTSGKTGRIQMDLVVSDLYGG